MESGIVVQAWPSPLQRRIARAMLASPGIRQANSVGSQPRPNNNHFWADAKLLRQLPPTPCFCPEGDNLLKVAFTLAREGVRHQEFAVTEAGRCLLGDQLMDRGLRLPGDRSRE